MRSLSSAPLGCSAAPLRSCTPPWLVRSLLRPCSAAPPRLLSPADVPPAPTRSPPQVPAREIHTPNVDSLASSGLILDRHYTYKFCSPSRSSLLSGRLPFHVNIYNDDPTMMPGQGVPVNMTMISSKLKTAGYVSHFIGKLAMVPGGTEGARWALPWSLSEEQMDAGAVELDLRLLKLYALTCC